MFTGIIETMGQLRGLYTHQENVDLIVTSSLSNTFRVDQSVAHNGVCLTVVEINIEEGWHRVTAIRETLLKSNLSDLQVGSLINLERCMPADGRFDGHIVQGHVDQVGRCDAIVDEAGSWRFSFSYDASAGNIIVEKGSVTINGISLTVVDAGIASFSVCIIPYTLAHTCFGSLKVGDRVNLEFDILGKYVARLLGKYTH